MIGTGGRSVGQFAGLGAITSARAVRGFAQVRVGRLIEVRAPHGLTSLNDIRAFVGEVVQAARQTGGPALLCADYRQASPLMPQAAGPWAHAMRESNELLIRSAVLVDPANAMFNLQIERVVRCASDSGRRRIFAKVPELRAWMSGVATDSELAAIDAFLSRHD